MAVKNKADHTGAFGLIASKEQLEKPHTPTGLHTRDAMLNAFKAATSSLSVKKFVETVTQTTIFFSQFQHLTFSREECERFPL